MTIPLQSRSRTLRVVAKPAESKATITDDQIVDAFARGESGYGELLYDRLIGVVEATLYRVFGSRGTDHDDLVQAAFEQIVTTLVNRRFARACSLRSWAAALTCNLALNAVRSRTTERRVFNRDEESCTVAVAGADPERDASNRQDLNSLRNALGAMPVKLAQTVILHDAFGHELSEIAVLTDVSVAAAQSRLVRGRRVLKELLAGDTSRRSA